MGEDSDDETSGDESPTSSVASYDNALSGMPLQQLGTTMTLLPESVDSSLTLCLRVFSDELVDKHDLHDVSWALDFSELPDFALRGIKTHVARGKRKRELDAMCDGDNSRDFGGSHIWRSKRRATQKLRGG